VTAISFATQTARYIRVTQTGSVSGLWWSIHEFNALGAVPSAPSTLTGFSISASQVGLSWGTGASATGYNVKRALQSGGPYTNITWNLTDTSYFDTSLTGGTPYYYVVAATNCFGEGPLSNEVAVRPVATNSPPLNFAASGGQIQLNWPVDHTGWRLQTQTNSLDLGLGTNWTTVANSTSTNNLLIPINGTNDSVFFRLVYP
jgi:hypothetical protein